MKIKAKQATSYILELTEEEANWLKCYLQNSRIQAESELDAAQRKKFFEAIDQEQRAAFIQ